MLDSPAYLGNIKARLEPCDDVFMAIVQDHGDTFVKRGIRRDDSDTSGIASLIQHCFKSDFP
jgi:hypothetical protein